jgi:hypothetical protein
MKLANIFLPIEFGFPKQILKQRRKEMNELKSIKVLEIIAEGLGMPYDSSLNEILAAMFLMEEDGELTRLLVEAAKQDLIEAWKAEGLIAQGRSE